MTKPYITVLQVVPDLETGGAEKTAVDIGAAIANHGWRSIIASAGGRLVEAAETGSSEHFTLPLKSKNPFTLWKNVGALERLIAERGVNLIHARSRAPAWSALLAAHRCKIPFVTTYHGAYSQRNAIKGFYNSVMARADTIIANSDWTADLIRERHPWADDRIVTVHRGTDFAMFKASAISDNRRQTFMRQWDVQENDFIFLHLARLTGWKGQSVVIDAAAQVLKAHPNSKFVLAGDAQGRSAYLDSLHAQIKDHGISDRVILPGHCDDPSGAMAVADAVIVASTRAEAFGRAAVEAAALEKPVIVTRIGAVSETVLATPDISEDERTGWKVQPGDASAMAKAIQEMMAMKDSARRAVGSRARLYCEEQFSLQQMCEKTIKIYETLLSNSHRSGTI